MSTGFRLLITLGDVAGVGPEIIARAWPELVRFCRPVVVGDPFWMRRGLELAGQDAEVVPIQRSGECESAERIVSVLAASRVDLRTVRSGAISPAAGQAAYDFLCAAIDQTVAGQADGIVTAPLHKEGLHRAGLSYPGHTEILAERTGTTAYGMMLFARNRQLPHGLGVVHVTLHCALRDVFRQLSTAAVVEKIVLLDRLLTSILERRPRLAVAGLNPHASDGGLFGEEEVRILAPAVQSASDQGVIVTGPWPADTLFVRARAGEFDGIVAMYHDQGHIPMKLLGGFQAVNITMGLPIVRTSVAHGTAYDIAGRGVADATSLIEAARVAAQLCKTRGWLGG
jgi:4-hydroxythreonine-4-phosphate dehydrogenase